MKPYKKYLFALLIVVPSVGNCLTLSDIETQVRRNLHDTASNASQYRYTQSFLYSVINEAQEDVVSQTYCLRTSTGYVLTANTTYYDLPTNFISANEVIFTDKTGNIYKVREESSKLVFADNPNYEKQQGGTQPTNYMIRTSTSGGVNFQICYYPVPSATSTGTVRVDYNYRAANMTTASDIPFDGLTKLYSYHNLLTYYSVGYVLLLEGNPAAAQQYYNLYNTGLSLMRDNLGNEHPNYNPGARPAK